MILVIEWLLFILYQQIIFSEIIKQQHILSSEYKAILSMPQRTNQFNYCPYNSRIGVAEISPTIA